jgi:nitrile hydratase subunit alpha
MSDRDTRKIIEIQEKLHSHLPSDPALRVKALESLLVDKGLLKTETVDRWIEIFTEEVGPKNGAKIVARAWIDPDFKQRLLANGTAAIAEMGFVGLEANDLVVVENTAERHNVVVCTLCSCYPWTILGIPPGWYKSFAYRSSVVREPRSVLREFGLEIGEDTEIRVWDSTAQVRYLVLPERPAGTDGLSQDALANLVTRNSMIGTEKIQASKSGA